MRQRIAAFTAVAVAAAAFAGCDSGDASETPAGMTTAATTTRPGRTTDAGAVTEPEPAGPVVLFQDDFSDEDSARWLVESTESASLDYSRGGYRFRIKNPKASRVTYSASLFGDRVAAVRIEADAVLRRGTSEFEVLGVVCVANSKGAGYFFGVGPQERYYSLEKIARNEFTVKREGRRNKAVRGLERTNRIRGECIGGGKKATRVHLLVNGKSLAAFKDRRGFDRFEAVGLAVFSVEGGADVVFDNVLERLDE